MNIQTAQKDTAERKLKRVKIGLMRNPKFALWSGILMVGDTIVDDKVPTACTDGRDEIYGRKFVEEQTDKGLSYVVLHECLHKAFRHLSIWRGLFKQNAQLANMACDYVINLMLEEIDPEHKFIEQPTMDGKTVGLLDKKYAGMNSKQVFDLLKKEQKKKQEEGGGGEGGEGQQSFDEHDWDGAESLTKEEVKELEREIEQAVRQGQMQHERLNGKGAGNMGRELDDLLNPKIDWKDALREFIQQTCANKDTSSWRRPNRRFLYQNIYMPSLIGEQCGRLVVGIDTSGSIRQEEITRFLSEVAGIVDLVHPEGIDLIYWDHKIAGHEEYDMNTLQSLATSTKPCGGGGTSPACVMEYIEEKHLEPVAVLMFTDGYIGNWGDNWKHPLLWVIQNGGSRIEAPNGRTINMDGA